MLGKSRVNRTTFSALSLCFPLHALTDKTQDVVPTATTQVTTVECMNADLRSALWARCDAFETAIAERLDRMESSVNERMERLESSVNERLERLESSFKERTDTLESSLNERLEGMDTSIAGLILTGEYEFSVKPHTSSLIHSGSYPTTCVFSPEVNLGLFHFTYC